MTHACLPPFAAAGAPHASAPLAEELSDRCNDAPRLSSPAAHASASGERAAQCLSRPAAEACASPACSTRSPVSDHMAAPAGSYPGSSERLPWPAAGCSAAAAYGDCAAHAASSAYGANSTYDARDVGGYYSLQRLSLSLQSAALPQRPPRASSAMSDPWRNLASSSSSGPSAASVGRHDAAPASAGGAGLRPMLQAWVAASRSTSRAAADSAAATSAAGGWRHSHGCSRDALPDPSYACGRYDDGSGVDHSAAMAALRYRPLAASAHFSGTSAYSSHPFDSDSDGCGESPARVAAGYSSSRTRLSSEPVIAGSWRRDAGTFEYNRHAYRPYAGATGWPAAEATTEPPCGAVGAGPSNTHTYDRGSSSAGNDAGDSALHAGGNGGGCAAGARCEAGGSAAEDCHTPVHRGIAAGGPAGGGGTPDAAATPATAAAAANGEDDIEHTDWFDAATRTLADYVRIYERQRDAMCGDLTETLEAVHEGLTVGRMAPPPGFRTAPVQEWWSNRKQRQLCVALHKPNQVRRGRRACSRGACCCLCCSVFAWLCQQLCVALHKCSRALALAMPRIQRLGLGLCLHVHLQLPCVFAAAMARVCIGICAVPMLAPLAAYCCLQAG